MGSGGGFRKISLSKSLACRNAALMSMLLRPKLWFAASAKKSFRLSRLMVGESDWGEDFSWNPLATNLPLYSHFCPSDFSFLVITHLDPMVSWPTSSTSSKTSYFSRFSISLSLASNTSGLLCSFVGTSTAKTATSSKHSVFSIWSQNAAVWSLASSLLSIAVLDRVTLLSASSSLMSLESNSSPIASALAWCFFVPLASFSSSRSKFTEFSFIGFATSSSCSSLLRNWRLLLGTFFILPLAIRNISLFLTANTFSGPSHALLPWFWYRTTSPAFNMISSYPFDLVAFAFSSFFVNSTCLYSFKISWCLSIIVLTASSS